MKYGLVRNIFIGTTFESSQEILTNNNNELENSVIFQQDDAPSRYQRFIESYRMI